MKSIHLAGLVGAILLSTVAASATDWNSCASDLDSLRRASRDASGQSEQAASAYSELEYELDELRNCRDYPDIYDLLNDGCSSQRREAEYARDSYESEVSNLSYELENVARKIRSVQWSCEFEFSLRRSASPPPSAQDSDWCQAVKSQKTQYSMPTLLTACKARATEEECRECLGIP